MVKKFWHLGNYKYVFYRFLVERLYIKYSFSKPNICILDAGCGPNVSSLPLIPEESYFVGVDISSKNILQSKRKAKNKNHTNLHYIQASVTDLPLRDEIVDMIICTDLLEHIKDKNKVIHEFARVCKKGGKLLGSTSNLLNPVMMLDCFMPKKMMRTLTCKLAGKHYERHLRLTSFKLTKVLHMAGFLHCGIKLLGFPPFQPWIYEFSNIKPPWFTRIWVAFDKMTNKKPLNLFKETIVFLAEKQ